LSSIRLKKILDKVFSKDELDLLEEKFLNLTLDLEEVHDIESFVDECREESKNFKVAGEHRLSDWEKGWSGDGVYYSDDSYNNLPFYFKNNTHIRVRDIVYKDNSGFAEVDALRALQLVIFRKILMKFDCNTVFEYGCGTGSNIQFLRNNINTLNFYGSDWAISACKKLVDNGILEQEKVSRVNYFNPSTYAGAKENYLAFTNASLEQSGKNYHDFMSYLFKNSNCLGGIHIEPIRELIDLKLKINQQSFEYAKNRGYLNGFYDYMSSNSDIQIIIANDYGIGSKYINGYQVLCWKKK